MKKILFYCQYLAGMGHLVRSTEILRSLKADFEVCFVNGGQDVPGFAHLEGVEIVSLPALWEDEAELKAVDPTLNLGEVMALRTQTLLDTFDRFRPDCVVTECFPFSKHKLKFELIPLLERAKDVNWPVKVVSSLRDLILTQPMSDRAPSKRQDKICKLIDQYYDLVLYHSDAQLVQLSDCFPRAAELNCEVFYTGYVTQSSPEAWPLSAEDAEFFASDRPAIVVSVGGGRHGFPLLESVARASQIVGDRLPHDFYTFAGPFMPEDQFQILLSMSEKQPNLSVRRFTSHLIDSMHKAELSINLGGYNTTMNVLKTRARSLLLPSPSEHQVGEQKLRSDKLEQLGILRTLSLEDLDPERMAAEIAGALERPQPQHDLNLNGAEQAALRLKALLNPATIPA
ncbi:MAG: glycosyltransferase [Cyanobacteria bacterium J06648_11]